jgi:Circadian oscillating protein COP23
MQSDNINLAKIFFISNLCMTSAFIAMSQLVVRAEHSYSFACNSIKNAKKVVPTTMILFSNGTSKPIIHWESNFIRNPKQQCEEVSKRFDDFSRLGNLHFLKFAEDRKTGVTMICGLSRSNKDRSCDRSNKLFELSKAIKDPKIVLNGLRNSLVIDDKSAILQGSDDTQVVDLAASIEKSQLDR